MTGKPFKAPLNAAFFCAAILAACTPDQSGFQAASTQCPERSTAIASVQGDGPESPMQGQQVTLRGIVTLVQDKHGLYMEEPGSDTHDSTSNAIFVQTTGWPVEVTPGTLISVRGQVSEIAAGRHPVTSITGLSELVPCASGQPLPLTEVTLPRNGLGREALEGMRVRLGEPLVITDVYQYEQGKFTISGNGFQFVPTEVIQPGPATADFDAKNKAFALPAWLPDHLNRPGMLVSGTAVEHVTGVLADDGGSLRLSLQSISAAPAPSLAPAPAATADTLRVVGMNLHNYFNGDGRGLGFPTERGAQTAEEFQQQRGRIGAAIKALEPHIVAVMELENDGFGNDSAAQDFIHLANDASGQPWAVTRPADDNTGDDKIAVGIFYRADRLQAIGPAQTLSGPEFTKSRQPQAQLFQHLPDGGKVLIVVNHLKSKGSCPDTGEDADQKDGQGCWNPMRTAAAEKMSSWAKAMARSRGTDNILILGDMNAYRNEQPIAAIRDAGFKELMDDRQGQTYSFVYYGRHGSLDYAFSSEALLKNLQQAFIWHVNAALPVNMELPSPWLRFSDHDPVVVDLRWRQSVTSD